jgi:hypothetical protein
MTTFAIRGLRVALAVLVLISVLVQVAIPGWASAFATRVPEVTHLVGPYSLAAILFIGCGEVVLLAVWRLLSFVRSGAIFSARAVRWVDLIIGSAVVATLLTVMVVATMIGMIPGGPGPTVYMLAAVVVGGVAFILLMIVMRTLLVSAVADRTELDGVV